MFASSLRCEQLVPFDSALVRGESSCHLTDRKKKSSLLKRRNFVLARLLQFGTEIQKKKKSAISYLNKQPSTTGGVNSGGAVVKSTAYHAEGDGLDPR